jgi:hypothetical protein
MNQLATIQRERGPAPVVPARAPSPKGIPARFDNPWAEIDALAVDADAAWNLHEEINAIRSRGCRGVSEIDCGITELDGYAAKLRNVGALAARLDDALAPANSRHIGEQLTMLVAAFRASTAPDPAAYSKLLFQEVSAVAPAVVVLVTACRHLRRTLKWPPAIAEVLSAIADHDATWRNRYAVAMKLPEARTGAIESLRKTRAEIDERNQHRRQLIEESIAELESELADAVARKPGDHLGRPTYIITREIERLRNNGTEE